MATNEYARAEWVPTNHRWIGRDGQRASWIVIHGTAGGSSAREVAGWFVNNSPPTSVHYVVGRDGAVVQCVHESDSAWGNGVLSNGHASWWKNNINPNLQTISIEHVKSDPHNAQGLTAEQQAASFALIAYLCAKWQIPARPGDAAGGIVGHNSIDPVNRADCPGTYPWAELYTYLGSGTGAGLSNLYNFNTQAMKVAKISKAPLSPGILGMVEQVDEWEQLPDFSLVDLLDRNSWVPFGLAYAEAVFARGLIILFGVMIVIICVFNAMKPLVEETAQVAGPVLQAAAAGAI